MTHLHCVIMPRFIIESVFYFPVEANYTWNLFLHGNLLNIHWPTIFYTASKGIKISQNSTKASDLNFLYEMFAMFAFSSITALRIF